MCKWLQTPSKHEAMLGVVVRMHQRVSKDRGLYASGLAILVCASCLRRACETHKFVRDSPALLEDLVSSSNSIKSKHRFATVSWSKVLHCLVNGCLPVNRAPIGSEGFPLVSLGSARTWTSPDCLTATDRVTLRRRETQYVKV